VKTRNQGSRPTGIGIVHNRRINRKKFHLETKMELEGLNVLEGSRDKMSLLKGEIKR
jgi:hypothetical protein